MKIGTKSVLYGAHCFFLHPIFVFLAWWKLYGFPWDPRLWIAFIVHDLGYWGKPNMDGPEGEEHVRFGAELMHAWFDGHLWDGDDIPSLYKWYNFCLYHSRYWAKHNDEPPSRLCFADKLAFVITPAWLYKLSVYLTGEWKEYARAHDHEVQHHATTLDGWYRPSRDYVRRWVLEHVDGREDTWTKAKPQSSVEEGRSVR